MGWYGVLCGTYQVNGLKPRGWWFQLTEGSIATGGISRLREKVFIFHLECWSCSVLRNYEKLPVQDWNVSFDQMWRGESKTVTIIIVHHCCDVVINITATWNQPHPHHCSHGWYRHRHCHFNYRNHQHGHLNCWHVLFRLCLFTCMYMLEVYNSINNNENDNSNHFNLYTICIIKYNLYIAHFGTYMRCDRMSWLWQIVMY